MFFEQLNVNISRILCYSLFTFQYDKYLRLKDHLKMTRVKKHEKSKFIKGTTKEQHERLFQNEIKF